MRKSFNRTHTKEQTSEETKNLARFISCEFAKQIKEPCEYLISATIATDIIYQLGIDGIVYPSVQLGGQSGLNIALSPKAVDENMKFVRTISQTLYKNKGKSFVRIESVTENGITRSIYHASDIEVALSIGIDDIHNLPLINL